MPNPFTEYKTIDEAKKTLKFEAKLPSAVPSGYKLEYVSVMSDDFLNLTYKNGEKEITYRTAAGTEDISGDYSIYEKTEVIEAGGCAVTVKGNGEKYNLAVWNNGDSYAISSSEGLSKDEIVKIAENIKTP